MEDDLKRSHRFILDEKGNPVACDEIGEWARWFETSGDKRTIARSETYTGIVISTVFLGLDYSFGNGPPMLYETMIFGGQHAEHQERAATLEGARAQHKRIRALAERSEPINLSKGYYRVRREEKLLAFRQRSAELTAELSPLTTSITASTRHK